MGFMIKLFEGTIEYLKTTLTLLRLKSVDKVSGWVSTAVPVTFIIGISLFALIFLHVGLAIWLGKLMGDLFFGFLAVGAFYAFFVFVFRLFLYKRVKRNIRNNLIKNLLS